MLNTAPDRTASRSAGLRTRFGDAPVGEAVQPCAFPHRIAALCALRGQSHALAGSGESLTHAELGARQARYARWALTEGFGPGATAVLLMADRPGRFALWLGLAQAGLRVALLDPALRGGRLARCLALAEPALLVADPALAEAIAAAPAAIPEGVAVRWHGPGADLARLDLEAADHDAHPLAEAERPDPAPDDAAFLVLGTDGNGRPVRTGASHARLTAWMEGAPDCPAAFRPLVEIGARLLGGRGSCTTA